MFIVYMKYYRSLRSDELKKLNNDKGLSAHCDNCKCKQCVLAECCKITDRQHVSSGSRAKTKSRYISVTTSEPVAAWWSSNTDGKPKYNSNKAKSATYVEIDMEYEPNKIIDTCERNYGATANNFAKASCEVLIMDDIKMEYITNIYRVKVIQKWEYDSLPNTYTKNGLFFKKLCNIIKGTKKYLLSLKIPKIGFNMEFDNFPKDYLLIENNADTDYESEIDESMDIDSQETNTDYEDNIDSQQEVIDITSDNEEINDSQEGITDVDSEEEYIRRPRNNTNKKKVVRANREVKNTTKKIRPNNREPNFEKSTIVNTLPKPSEQPPKNLKLSEVKRQINDIVTGNPQRKYKRSFKELDEISGRGGTKKKKGSKKKQTKKKYSQ